jgi:sodium/potassium-transporting ATPase subunit alpha
MQKGNGAPTFFFQNDGNYAQPYTTQRGFTLDAAAQHKALAQAQSMVYFGIMIMQMFNLFACKTRYVTYSRYTNIAHFTLTKN